VIDRFFQKTENSLIYICSDENEKAEKRHEIFNRSYKKSKFKDHIIKIDNIISFPIGEHLSQKLFTSFMFHKQNSNCEKLIGEFYNLTL